MKKNIFIILIFGLFFSPFAEADIINPTVTKVYFEKNGEPYEEEVKFTVKGYGYAMDEPGDISSYDPGDYVPEVVYSFSAKINSYGAQIYEDYYMNYRHIDYFELEGESSVGGKFQIKDIKALPKTCHSLDQYDNVNNEGYFKVDENYWDCIFDNSYADSACDQYSHKLDLSDKTLIKNDQGDLAERLCELRFDLTNAHWTKADSDSCSVVHTIRKNGYLAAAIVVGFFALGLFTLKKWRNRK